MILYEANKLCYLDESEFLDKRFRDMLFEVVKERAKGERYKHYEGIYCQFYQYDGKVLNRRGTEWLLKGFMKNCTPIEINNPIIQY
jgi:hypothetical protein